MSNWYPPTTYEPAAGTGQLLLNPPFAMHEQKCGNCRYARGLAPCDHVRLGGNGVELSCRRHAPAVQFDPGEWSGSLRPTAMWPVVYPAYWCGEWAPQEVRR